MAIIRCAFYLSLIAGIHSQREKDPFSRRGDLMACQALSAIPRLYSELQLTVKHYSEYRFSKVRVLFILYTQSSVLLTDCEKRSTNEVVRNEPAYTLLLKTEVKVAEKTRP